MRQKVAKKVLLIGWDAADWKVINPLLDRGLMPALNDLVNNGVMGNLATLRPILSPMLWTSIATGKRADKHGIQGFMEPDPQTGGLRPVSSTSRKVKAIWNILTQHGFKTHALGWFASHPAEPINGVSVSDLYPYAVAPPDKAWPLPPGAVHPESRRRPFAKLRMHPAEVTEAAILPWIPRAPEIDQEQDKRLVHSPRSWRRTAPSTMPPPGFSSMSRGTSWPSITMASTTSRTASCTFTRPAWRACPKTSSRFTRTW